MGELYSMALFRDLQVARFMDGNLVDNLKAIEAPWLPLEIESKLEKTKHKAPIWAAEFDCFEWFMGEVNRLDKTARRRRLPPAFLQKSGDMQNVPWPGRGWRCEQKVGIHKVTATSSLISAVSQAGGLNSIADPGKVYVFRNYGDEEPA